MACIDLVKKPVSYVSMYGHDKTKHELTVDGVSRGWVKVECVAAHDGSIVGEVCYYRGEYMPHRSPKVFTSPLDCLAYLRIQAGDVRPADFVKSKRKRPVKKVVRKSVEKVAKPKRKAAKPKRRFKFS